MEVLWIKTMMGWDNREEVKYCHKHIQPVLNHLVEESTVRSKVVSTSSTWKPNDGASYWLKSGDTRNLTYLEYLKKREGRRCFRCGLIVGLGHRCLQKNARVVILPNDEQVNELDETSQIKLYTSEKNDEETPGVDCRIFFFFIWEELMWF